MARFASCYMTYVMHACMHASGAHLTLYYSMHSISGYALAMLYEQHVDGTRPPRWPLCQAAKVPVPRTSSDVKLLIQLDFKDSKIF